MRERNRERYGAAGLDFVLSDYESLTFSEIFDCAVFYDSLHHATDEKSALETVHRALRPGGVLITHEPGAGHSKSPDSLRAMELYGVTEKTWRPLTSAICAKRLVMRISSFFRTRHLPSSRFTASTLPGSTGVEQPWWRRLLQVGRLFTDRRLQHGGICVITK